MWQPCQGFGVGWGCHCQPPVRATLLGSRKNPNHPAIISHLLSKQERDLQLQICQKVLDELTAPKHRHLNTHILDPDDPESSRWAKWLTTNSSDIQESLSKREYTSSKQFAHSVRIMSGRLSLNRVDSCVARAVSQLRQLFDEEWAGQQAWITAHLPPSASESTIGATSADTHNPAAIDSECGATTASLSTTKNISNTETPSSTD